MGLAFPSINLRKLMKNTATAVTVPSMIHTHFLYGFDGILSLLLSTFGDFTDWFEVLY